MVEGAAAAFGCPSSGGAELGRDREGQGSPAPPGAGGAEGSSGAGSSGAGSSVGLWRPHPRSIPPSESLNRRSPPHRDGRLKCGARQYLEEGPCPGPLPFPRSCESSCRSPPASSRGTATGEALHLGTATGTRSTAGQGGTAAVFVGGSPCSSAHRTPSPQWQALAEGAGMLAFALPLPTTV